jgi:hypothetical protein
MTGLDISMQNIGKLTVKDQIYYKLRNLLLVLIKLLLRQKAKISNKKLLNSEMSKNSNTETRMPGKKVACHIKTLRNLRMFTV